MVRRHYGLPALTALAAFEAAARAGSFKAAAAELNVTPGAVSHQVKALERELGFALFARQHRGVALTEAGQTLSLSLEQGFSDIAGTIRRLRRAHLDPAVTVGTTTAFSALWLTPRLARFWTEHGDVSVHQDVSDQPVRSMGLVDLRIRYGRLRNPELEEAELFRDTLVPLAAPGVANALEGAELEVLARQKLVHLDADNADWTTWGAFFATLGHGGPIAGGIRVNNYAIALQAAQDGAGLVLGWQRLSAPLIARGDLVVIGPHRLPAPHGFHLISLPVAKLDANTSLLRDWLLKAARQMS